MAENSDNSFVVTRQPSFSLSDPCPRRNHRMRRRELMLFLGGAMAVARTLGAQQKTMPVIGLLGAASPGPAAAFLAPFRQGLSETGYVEGDNVAFEYRWAESHYDRLRSLAVDLVGRNVDVIAAQGGTPPALAAKSATSAIPIVFTSAAPVEFGLVASLAHPGGNLTGVSFLSIELMPKRLELLSPGGSPIPSMVNEVRERRSGSQGVSV
jgi:putative ABC transport system substrate-binding protein